MRTFYTTFIFSLILLGSCTHLNSVSLTQVPEVRTKKVSTTVSKTIFLAFNFNNDFVDEVSSSLASKCENGEIRGILTKHETVNYFFVHTINIHATGYCHSKGESKS